MKALKPTTPRWWSVWRLSRLSGTRPPQSPKSTSAFRDATASFSSNAAAVVVGGCALSGISRTVVTPPAAAPRVPASHPSQSARPGSRGQEQSHFFYSDVLRAFPEGQPADFGQLFLALRECREVVSCQLPDLAREHRGSIRKEQLGLADPARIQQQHAGRGMAGVILEIEPELLVAHGNPR